MNTLVHAGITVLLHARCFLKECWQSLQLILYSKISFIEYFKSFRNTVKLGVNLTSSHTSNGLVYIDHSLHFLEKKLNFMRVFKNTVAFFKVNFII